MKWQETNMITRFRLVSLLLAATAAAAPPVARFDLGKQQYATICGQCHKPDGMGQVGLAPPLVNSEWVLGSETRLARIVDRARMMELDLPTATTDRAEELRQQIGVISRRARLMNRAITLGTFAALLVAAIVALLFAAAFLAIPLGSSIAVVFIVAMVSLVGALWCFLIEIRISTASLRFAGARRPVP
jgi:hypothetical protein